MCSRQRITISWSKVKARKAARSPLNWIIRVGCLRDLELVRHYIVIPERCPGRGNLTTPKDNKVESDSVSVHNFMIKDLKAGCRKPKRKELP
jgi:hypothetical protein